MARPFAGLISDTHGLLRPQALELLAGARLILHAGDIGKPEVLEALGKIAPVVAVRGNVDRDAWAVDLPECREVEVFGKTCCLLHDVKALPAFAEGRFQAIIYGHSHKPECLVKNGALFINPGSAGPRRFRLPVAVGKLFLRDDRLEGEVIHLTLDPPGGARANKAGTGRGKAGGGKAWRSRDLR